MTGLLFTASNVFAAGSFLSPDRGSFLSPGYFGMNSNAIVGALGSYTLGSLVQPWPGVWSTFFAATGAYATSTFAGGVAVGTTTTQYQLQVINPLTSNAVNATTTISVGDMVSTSTSRSSINMMTTSGSTSCLYIIGTTNPSVVVSAGACK